MFLGNRMVHKRRKKGRPVEPTQTVEPSDTEASEPAAYRNSGLTRPEVARATRVSGWRAVWRYQRMNGTPAASILALALLSIVVIVANGDWTLLGRAVFLAGCSSFALAVFYGVANAQGKRDDP